MSDGAQNVRLVGYNDLQGHQSLQVTTRSDAANGNWVYVGHSPNNRSAPTAQEERGPDEPQVNPITGAMEYNGTSLIDITDPSKPTTKWHIPGAKGANHRSVSVVYDYKHDGSGNDYHGTRNKPESDRARRRDHEPGPKPVVDNGTPIPAPAPNNQTN